jgi:hypothetical protein
VNFNGTGTVAIRASGNVSSITDNGTGDYTINFTTAMPDANYVPQLTIQGRSDQASQAFNGLAAIYGNFASGATLKTTTQLRIATGFSNTSIADAAEINAAIFR